MLLCGDSDFLADTTYRGLFIKDADPDSSDDFDTVMTRGSRSVSVHYNIPLDINWASDFEFSKSDAVKYRFFIEPVTAARKDPSRNSSYYGYWADSFVFDDGSNERIITYSVPLIYEKSVYGVIGITLSCSRLSEMLGEDNSERGLVLFSSKKYTDNEDLNGIVQAMSNISSVKNVASGSQINLVPAEYSDIAYTTESIELEDGRAYCTASEVRLYSSDSYYENTWYIAAVEGENSIYSAYEYMRRHYNITTIIMSVFGLACATAFVAAVARAFAKFRDAVKSLIGKDGSEKKVSFKNKELAELYEQVSDMAEERREAVLSYEGEHELCSIALRSSNSSIFQYINAEDVFIIFHFDKDRKYCFARRSVYNNFRKRVMEGEVCPEEDINTVITFLDGQMNESFRTRVYTKDKAVIS